MKVEKKAMMILKIEQDKMSFLNMDISAQNWVENE